MSKSKQDHTRGLKQTCGRFNAVRMVRISPPRAKSPSGLVQCVVRGNSNPTSTGCLRGSWIIRGVVYLFAYWLIASTLPDCQMLPSPYPIYAYPNAKARQQAH